MTSVGPVKIFFEICRPQGRVNSSGVKGVIIDLVRAGNVNPDIKVREISGVAKKYGTFKDREYVLQVRVAPDITMSSADLKVELYRGPLNINGLPREFIDSFCEPSFVTSQSEVNYLFDERSTEKLFLYLAAKDSNFVELIETFNRLTGYSNN